MKTLKIEKYEQLEQVTEQQAKENATKSKKCIFKNKGE